MGSFYSGRYERCRSENNCRRKTTFGWRGTILPILTNRMLVTETMPLPVRKSGTTKFAMGRLKNNDSKTLKHHKYTLEFTSNPAWYAVQALPYIMEYPYECAEQTFSRYYANILATHIANSDPKIKRVFEIWRNTPNSDVLLSNLEKNQELKALMLQETPWVLEAQNETERKHRIALLFDLNRMSMESKSALKKLEEQQKYNGGWAWFKGMPESCILLNISYAVLVISITLVLQILKRITKLGI
jgi:hypothetical protein